MFSETAELYDAIYASFKDYGAEVAKLVEILRREAPHARTLLDVACGTGEHARILQGEHAYVVQGLDIEPTFVALARRKVPAARFWEADMADFDLADRFDAVLCLFSSIGYLLSLERVEAALRCFRRHLAPGGVVLVEPWFAPEDWRQGRVYLNTVETDDLKVARMSHSTVEGRVSKLVFEYLVGTSAGLEHRTEHHDLLLLTTDELRSAFTRAGFATVEHDPQGPTGRGLFVAKA